MNKHIYLQIGALPTTAEIATANFLIKHHFAPEITFIAASKIKGRRTPDIKANGLRWEIKCPIGKGSNTIKRAFEVAIQQSGNIIFDLRHSKCPDEVNIRRLKKEFYDLKKARRLIVITKSQKC